MNKGRFHIELWAYEQISRSVESGFEAWILDFSVHKLVRRLSLSIWHPIYLKCILCKVCISCLYMLGSTLPEMLISICNVSFST